MKSLKYLNKGMTLVELLVVISIFLLVTSTMIFDYDKYRSSTSTYNLTNDIALSVRKAQSYAIGVRGTSSIFNYGHGVHFTTNANTSSSISGSQKSFVLFTDISSNNQYTYSGSTCGNPISSNECEEVLTINSADTISKIYLEGVLQSSGGILDIIFLRPNPDAFFCYRTGSADTTCDSNFSYVKIEVSNGQVGGREVTKQVTIWNTGQISVN